MIQQIMLLVTVPAIAVAVPLLLLEARAWPLVAGGLGVIGLSLSAWTDFIDNCAGSCVEDDPPLLSSLWGLSAALATVGAVALCASAALRRRRSTDERSTS